MRTALLPIVLLTVQIAAAQGTSLPSAEERKVYHQHLGDEHLQRGDFDLALAEYFSASEAAGHHDTHLLKRIATLKQWTRHYSAAKEWLGKAIEQIPNDIEAREDLRRLQSNRGLQLSGTFGGGDIDYARNTHNLGAFYGGIDWLDLHGGYSSDEKLFYDRSSGWVDAYFFPHFRTYVRLGLQWKQYTYPRSVNTPPDNNAYVDVPDYQLELGYTYYKESYASLEVEVFTPNFFWNRSLRAHNFKIGGTLRSWLVRPVYFKVFASALRDPDPQSFVMEPTTNTIRGFRYERVTLVGGAIGIEDNRWNVELKYVPDRDLDRSLDWSLFGRIRYDAGNFRIQYDILHDNYRSSSFRGFQSSQVHMVTMVAEPILFLELKAGVKALVRGITTLSPFLSVRIKTGV